MKALASPFNSVTLVIAIFPEEHHGTRQTDENHKESMDETGTGLEGPKFGTSIHNSSSTSVTIDEGGSGGSLRRVIMDLSICEASLPSHCLTSPGSFPHFTWLWEKNPSRNSVDWYTKHVAKPAQPMPYHTSDANIIFRQTTGSYIAAQVNQFVYYPDRMSRNLHLTGVKRMPNHAAELFRLFNIACFITGSDPRRAMSSAYSTSVAPRALRPHRH
ncbi:hypothetical protein CSKR_112521 [Clonorchis sinensis]|uniref:Uncharacterized protein n=1 Tax=Clonorchis sinensis TaxID=79923 RepID=A0A419PS77_CLOSI|nr:hypothetical protein CSKR_112521 [Clonorchis sinensis]